MFDDNQGETSEEIACVLIPSPPNDEERNADPNASVDNAQIPRQSTPSILPVWLLESSKDFQWSWAPLPFRKVGRAIASWVKGPNPPQSLLLTPSFPQWQELPVRYLDRYFPKRKHKVALLLLLYCAWSLPWTFLLIQSRSAGYIEGYGQPQTLSCASTYWAFGNGCGLNGNGCRPFSGATFAFRCPADCRAMKLLEPHTVGNETVQYQPLVVGGPDPSTSEPGIYRADSFICQAAVHAGVIPDSVGGCGVVSLEGDNRNFHSSKRHGILSVAFPSTFPKSFSFIERSELQANCPEDPRWSLLGVTIAALVLLWIFSTSPPVLFFSTFVILMFHVGLVSDPPSNPDLNGLVSLLFSRLLPASFCMYVLYVFCARPLLAPLSSPIYQFSKAFLYLPMAFLGALNNYTFDKWIPLARLTPTDIQQQPGAKIALALIAPSVLTIVLGQAWHIRQGGLMPRYLQIYGTMAVSLLALISVPGLRLRVHHYILAILLMPGTAFPTRPSLIYQGLLFGLFVNGIARWGFASIIETPVALGEPASGPGWKATYPNITSASVFVSLPDYRSDETYRGNGNITFALWEHQRMEKLGVDGVTVLINDVERYRAYIDEQRRGEFSWRRRGHQGWRLQPYEAEFSDLTTYALEDSDIKGGDDFDDNGEEDDNYDHGHGDNDDDDEPEDLFFRFAFLRGSQVGKYSSPGIWLKNGTWIPPPPPPQ